MGLMDVLFGRGAPAPAATTATPTIRGPEFVPYLDSRAAVGLSAVWRCVTLIADAVADMPWQEWRGETELTPSRLVRRPFALMTRREWTWRVVATEALWNSTYLLHVGGTDSEGAPWSLLPLPPSIVQPWGVVDPWGITPPTDYMVAGQRVPAEYLSIVRRAPWPGMMDSMTGLLEVARRQFTAYVAADVHLNRYWTAGGPTTTVITSDAVIDNDAAADIAQRWMDRRAMGTEWPAVLGSGADAKPWGADPTSESAVEARREMTADIGRYFGVATRILNAPAGDSETYSNVENDAIDFYRYTLRGYMGPVEDVISELLPGDYQLGRRMTMDPARMLQGDLASRAVAYPALVASEIYTIDEARMRGFGLAPRGSAPAPAPVTDVIVEPSATGIGG